MVLIYMSRGPKFHLPYNYQNIHKNVKFLECTMLQLRSQNKKMRWYLSNLNGIHIWKTLKYVIQSRFGSVKQKKPSLFLFSLKKPQIISGICCAIKLFQMENKLNCFDIFLPVLNWNLSELLLNWAFFTVIKGLRWDEPFDGRTYGR